MSELNLYNIYIPELGTAVQFKSIDPNDTEAFVESLGSVTSAQLKTTVLEKYIFNLKSDVLNILLSREDSQRAEDTLNALYRACVQLNPILDVDLWLQMAFFNTSTNAHNPPLLPGLPFPPDEVPPGIYDVEDEESSEESAEAKEAYDYKKIRPFRLTPSKFASTGEKLRSGIVGQEEAVRALETILGRNQAGLGDRDRPLGVLVFAGSSGTGKTLLAKNLHKHLFGADTEIVRIDCGEFQHKHENQKLLGSPNGYIGHESGSSFMNAMMKQPNTVVLLDEVEKAHPDIFNTFLRIFDEGLITDARGNVISFRNSIIIMTTNLGNKKIVDDLTSGGVGFGSRIGTDIGTSLIPKREAVERSTLDAIHKFFNPEFLNRIDDVVVFNHLTKDNYLAIAELEVAKVDAKLASKGIRFSYDQTTLEGLVERGSTTIKGARGLEAARRDGIENLLAETILKEGVKRGAMVDVCYEDGEFQVEVSKPAKKAKQ